MLNPIIYDILLIFFIVHKHKIENSKYLINTYCGFINKNISQLITLLKLIILTLNEIFNIY